MFKKTSSSSRELVTIALSSSTSGERVPILTNTFLIFQQNLIFPEKFTNTVYQKNCKNQR